MSLQFEIDTSDIEALLKKYDSAQPLINKEMKKAMQQSVDVVEGQVKGRTPVNTGALRNSIATQIKGDLFDMRGQVMSPLVYAIVMEKGRARNSTPPPVGPIELWVIRKGIARAGKESKQAAYVIARSIGRKGIPALKMFEKGLKASIPAINKAWANAGQRIAKALD